MLRASVAPAPSSSIRTRCSCRWRARSWRGARLRGCSRGRTPDRAVSRLMVGGSLSHSMAMRVAATPAAPHAPCGCPICDFSDDIGILCALQFKRDLHRLRLDAVVQDRRGAVQVGILHVGGGDAGFCHRQADGTRGLFRASPGARDGKPRRWSRVRRSRRRYVRRVRARVRSSSRTNIHEPSARTKPSRFAVNGREPFSGSWFQDLVMMRIR